MKRNGEIEAYDGERCVECGELIYKHDDYHTIKRNKKIGGGFIHIHKACYESLLPKNNLRKR